MANGWTPERKAKQSQLIHTWKPWEKNTGPRSAAGKLIVSQNAFKGGLRSLMKDVAMLLRDQKERLNRFI